MVALQLMVDAKPDTIPDLSCCLGCLGKDPTLSPLLLSFWLAAS